MRRPLVTERYVLAEHSPNKNVSVRKDPDDSESVSKKTEDTDSDPANVLPFGGLAPANCRECSVVLPTTAADHDLAVFLVECVTPDENGDAVLNTGKILACVKEEFKR